MDTKKLVTSSILVSATAVGSVVLSKREKRQQLMMNLKRLRARVFNRTKEDHEEYFEEKIGHSDPYDTSDNKMVGEGAQYSVNYYNKKKQ